ncbi:hypothetical protein PACTADRAFT_34267 [Pachysolen tannophilus NRRL Y-2460]|uniref:N-acetyltransferase domain-containing protein n=1 Tax=Pachysolen tannophilus NRRL Y-2460 TaxID=669874 RepID=A0A1E4TVF9_PACTA|nr:hypothetical protein PACTADRAFT_34267 [Pachysolen tannophilus NRRL Y-2460]
MDYSKYPIKQINSSDYPEKKLLLRDVITSTSIDFKGNLPSEVFVITECEVADISQEPWHQFYMIDSSNNDEIICSFRIMYKPGNVKNCNLLIGNVHTNPKYRKKGFAGYMISECIKKYEIEGYEFECPLSDNDETDKYLNEYLLKGKYNYFWSLYSGVSEYYARFGFKSYPEMNWLIYEEPVPAEKQHEFNSLENQELQEYPGVDLIPLKHGDISNITDFFSGQDYVSYINENDNGIFTRSTNLSSPTIHNFYVRDKTVSSYYDRSYKYIGLRIKDSTIGKETFVIFCGALDYSGLLLPKLFTNLNSEIETEREILAKDINYLLNFLKDSFQNYSFLKFSHVNSIKLSITTADICTKDAKTTEFIMNQLISSGWKLDTSNKNFLPMLKDFGKKGTNEDIKWINNGFWCFG